MKVKLLTRSGDYVAVIDSPPFEIPPEIIQWGERHFVHKPSGEYREGMLWHTPVFKPSPHREGWRPGAGEALQWSTNRAGRYCAVWPKDGGFCAWVVDGPGPGLWSAVYVSEDEAIAWCEALLVSSNPLPKNGG